MNPKLSMSEEQRKQVLRLPKRHSREAAAPPDPEAGALLARAQSLRAALVAAIIVIVAFSATWAMLASWALAISPSVASSRMSGSPGLRW